MRADDGLDLTTAWLNELQPEGLVLGANVLRERGLEPERQGAAETEGMAALLGLDPREDRRENDHNLALADPWSLFAEVLSWPEALVAGAPGGPDLPGALTVTLPEHEGHIAPDWAVLWHEPMPDAPLAQLLVMVRPDLDPDKRGQEEGWEASPHQQLVRLLQDTGVAAGVLVARNALRLVHAPRGETPGWITWPLATLARTEGRGALGGLKVALGPDRFFVGPDANRLHPLLRASREAQNDVSERLSGQVLGALHELLRGLHRADPHAIEALARENPRHLYEGLLTALMRLVFLLYAEDRDLLPTSREPRAQALWESGYSLAGLFQRLEDDAGRTPDTMDDRRGAWGRLLAVFRLVHKGHGAWIKGRGGKLFDPEAFPFLEGGVDGGSDTILRVSDGCVHRVLEGLMTLPAPTRDGARERLSYRALDVEQIGSVYETVMGFTAESAAERMICVNDKKGLPTFIGLDTLLARKSGTRMKWLKDHDVEPNSRQGSAIQAARTEEDLVAALAMGQARGHCVGLIDLRGSPNQAPIGSGAPFLQPTEERRRSGSHYTPRTLTGPIVTHALSPAFERLGEDAAPEAVLGLKVCDPACGSGAFLVESCRQLAERLEQAWARHPIAKPAIPSDETDTIHARRLVAQRCLYGVDRNPMAVDLAKLSLWLATLAAEHEFTFLDHALKCGDSLVGLTAGQIGAMRWSDDPKQGTLFLSRAVPERITAWRGTRSAIRTARHDAPLTDLERDLAEAEARLADIRAVGDAVVSTFFAASKTKARLTAMKRFQADFDDCLMEDVENGWAQARRMAREMRAGECPVTPFHWEVEFPEAFEQGGYDAVVGNPPFAGKNTISNGSGPFYIPWLQHLHAGAHGNADLVAHFFRRAYALLRPGGAFGLIATNTIGQGDTRASGLQAILGEGGAISRAVKRFKWPGAAAVVVSVVHVVKGNALAPTLDGRAVERVSAFLVPGHDDASPHPLEENEGKAFIGSYLLGMGFTFDDAAAAKGEAEPVARMRELIEKNPRNAERIRPYIGGEEVNTSPVHAHHRWAIDFEDFPRERDASLKSWWDMSDKERETALASFVVSRDYPQPTAKDWPDLLEILERLVKPTRQSQGSIVNPARWWMFARPGTRLSKASRGLSTVLALSRVSPQHALTPMPPDMVFAETTVVFALPSLAPFAVLQSRVHEVWARFFSSTLEDRLRYAPSDCFETFPFPEVYESDPALEAAGQAYHDCRAALMVATDLGMTKTYNRFHDPELRDDGIARMRALHEAMDHAVLAAYGWGDLVDSVRSIFLARPADQKGRGARAGEPEDDHTYQGRLHWPQATRDEVLRRLIALNKERFRTEGTTDRAESPLERARRLSEVDLDEWDEHAVG